MVSFVATEIRNDEPYENKEGTPLNADSLNQITENIINKGTPIFFGVSFVV